MVLVPVGESAVSISINGTERVNELISDDTSYDLTESLGSTIKVNGSNKGSFTQTSDSTYDISVSDERSFDTTRVVSKSGGSSTPSGTFSTGGWHRLYLTNSNKNVQVYINGNEVASVYSGTRNFMININSGDTWSIDPYNYEANWTCYIDRVKNHTTTNYPDGTTVHIPTGINVDSVNKS